MNTIKLTYFGLVPLLALTSCAQEELIPGNIENGDERIIFHTIFPTLTSTRARDIDTDNNPLSRFQVTAFTLENAVTDGPLNHFFSETLEKGSDETFSSASCKWPKNKGENEGKLKFFAFYPPYNSLIGIEDEAVTTESFSLVNNSTVTGDATNIDYRIDNFHVAKDMDNQVDFVTAQATGSKTQHLFSGVRLGFRHQLCRIDLAAKGSPTGLNVEVGGVRLGGVCVGGTFNFSPNDTEGAGTAGFWEPASLVKGKVEYVFREGDTIIRLNTADTPPLSLMGNTEAAMVIPAHYEQWNHKEDSENASQGMYFCVLVRVTDNYGNQAYPYIGSEDETIVYLAVDKTDGATASSYKVMKRLYHKEGNEYYTDSSLTQRYELNANEEIREFAWAAIPMSVKWEAGYKYSYVLDYSGGVGLQDPDGPAPGKPILSPISIGVETTVNPWGETGDPVISDFEEGDTKEIILN